MSPCSVPVPGGPSWSLPGNAPLFVTPGGRDRFSPARNDATMRARMTDASKDLFLCHSSVDKAWVEALGQRVESEEWDGRHLSVFLDSWDIELGENIIIKLDEALAQARFVALVLTPEMVTSDWCKAEYAATLATDPTNRRGRLIPIRLRDFHQTTGERLQVPPFLAGLNHLDFRAKNDFDKQTARLLARLKGESPRRGTGGVRRPRLDAETLVQAVPEGRDEADPIPEQLLSNLLPVTALPKVVWSAASTLRDKKDLPPDVSLPACVLREERLYAFHDLTVAGGPFSQYVTAAVATRHSPLEWQNDPRWRWYIELLNQCLRDHLRPEVAYDKEHHRFWFVPQGMASVALKRGEGRPRTVVRAPDKGAGGYWVHHAASLQFETLASSLFLSINPTYVFTTDGWRPAPEGDVPALAAQWGGRERNGAILRSTLLWADVVAKGKKRVAIPAGDQGFEISRLPATVESPVGLATDRVRVRDLLRFSQEEWNLDTALGFIVGDEVVPDLFEDDFDV